MNHERTIRKLNNALGMELGRNLYGEPKYRWAHSESPELLHPMRVEGYDMTASPSGLIVAAPKFVMRKKCLTLNNQWVICRWVEPISEDEWRRLYGYSLEWPNRGELAPTNVDMPPGVTPSENDNARAIAAIRQMLDTSVSAQIAALRDQQEKRERDTRRRNYEEIREELTTYDHVPGRKGQVSYPSVLVN